MPRLLLFRAQEFSPELLLLLQQNFDLIENLLNGQMDSFNILDGSIGTAELAASAVTFAKALTSDFFVTGQYTGDDAAGREINLGWRARRVTVIKHDDSTIFDSIGSLSAELGSFWRVLAGGLSTGTTNWQGCSANGFKTGSAASNLSNKNAVIYSYSAWR